MSQQTLKAIAAAALGCFMATAAQAQTYSQYFGTIAAGSVSSGPFTGAPAGGPAADPYMVLNGANPAQSFTGMINAGMTSLTVSFWYGSNDNSPSGILGFFNVSGPSLMPDSAFNLRNPTPGTAENPGTSGRNSGGTFFTQTFTNPAAGNWEFSFTRTAGQLRVDDFTVTAVPEPSTYALMLAGLGVVGFYARRRQKASADQRMVAA